jgi:aminodeoxyfutalosine deaminase
MTGDELLATLEGEYLAVATGLGLRPAELAQLAGNAVSASFLDPPRKVTLLSEIDAVARDINRNGPTG